MKKILVLLFVLFIGVGAAQADTYLIDNLNMVNFWEKNGKDVEKINNVSQKLLIENKITNRMPVMMVRDLNTANAVARSAQRSIHVYSGLLPYIDNDDELAYVIAHEMGHILDYYEGPWKPLVMNFNSKKYESRADAIAIDMMVKAGYDPIAAITVSNKIFGEPQFDWGSSIAHPKGSTRMISVYKIIYVKYPQFLNSPLTQTSLYKNFLYTMDNEIKNVQQEHKSRTLKNKDINL